MVQLEQPRNAALRRGRLRVPAMKEIPMPLRDHFRPPVSTRSSWEEIHAMWPAAIVQYLHKLLPPGYVAGPRVHLGAPIEIDVSTYEMDDAPAHSAADSNGGSATATLPSTVPLVTVETEPLEEAEYEVRVYDA